MKNVSRNTKGLQACATMLFLVAVFGCGAVAVGEQKSKQPPKGFQSLFNGKNLDNWKGQIAEDPRDIAKLTQGMTPEQVKQIQQEADLETLKHWTAEDGVIHYDGTRRIGNLETREHFGDFEMYVDWKIPTGGDSGIFPRNMPQVQIWDPAGGKRNVVGSGGLDNNGPNIPPTERADNPVGEWNTFYIKMIGDTIWVKLNGQTVIDGKKKGNYWKEFKEPAPARGPIVLQSHGSNLWFRNFFIRQLDETSSSIEPRGEVIRPFNGKDLSGFTTWLRKSDRNETEMNYSVEDGMIHISGEGMGYLATVDSYKNYHLSIEYRWGKRTDGSKYVRNSGILLHSTGPEGNARGIWMASIEIQLAQGCEGDLIVIRGKDEKGKVIPVNITSDTATAGDGRTRWKKGGKKTPYAGKQFWWSQHQVGFKELLDTRGKDDVASPLGEWTKVECICDGDRITVKINGQTVNECYNVFPSAGRILLENEKNEIYFRNFEIKPLKK